ncbi:hypothetical protein [Nonomuraea guangzhouensis]|uniref:WxL domain-containing protein n=1 Tax=Nonomuraea guangzhouensis TaxID=1291555 RepID=A0ABW4GZ20_9ACTN|nr:hypothetical protein [Nonomuraea guangzhouensis]
MKALLRTGLVGLAGVMTLGALTGIPAEAGTCANNTACNTTTTFDVTVGALEITVPNSTVDLTNDAAPGGNAYGQLGSVTVNDARASATPTWTASVTSSSFTTGGGDDPGETITNASVSYCSGTASATTGNGTFTAGQTGCANPPPATGQALSASRTAYSHSGGTGSNSATWNPLITIAVALSNVGGQYTGTITHTVT